MWGILPRAVWEGFKEEEARSRVYLQGGEPGKAPVTRLWKVGSLSVEAKCEAEGSVHPFRGAQASPCQCRRASLSPSSRGPVSPWLCQLVRRRFPCRPAVRGLPRCCGDGQQAGPAPRSSPSARGG